MYKKALVIAMVLILAISQTACSNKATEAGEQTEVVIPMPKDGSATLTILLNPLDAVNFNVNPVYKDYIEKFERDFGIEIKLERIGTDPGRFVDVEDRSDYIKKLSTKLYTADGPELIYSDYLPLEPLMRQKAVEGLRDKIPNLNKVYDGLLDPDVSFIPVSVKYFSKLINLDELEKTGLDKPGINWTSQERFEIRSKWLAVNKVYFNGYEYNITFDSLINLDKQFNQDKNAIVLDTPEIKQGIRDVRDYIFHGDYVLNKEYSFENYYNMMFEEDSSEYQESFDLFAKNVDSGHIDSGRTENLLRAEEVDYKNRSYGTIMLPEFSDRQAMAATCGFAVNKNGKNLELAYLFINGLLSDEMQMKIYKEDSQEFYPVNKDVEDDIRKLEEVKVEDERVLETKAYVLNLIKNGQVLIDNTANLRCFDIKRMLYKELSKIILADREYSDAELSAMLKELENKYNIYLNE